jgi:hypothetical protein
VAEVTAWQSRPLEPVYPVVFVDALRVQIRDEATVRIKAVYLALAVLPDGSRDILGMWIEQTGGLSADDPSDVHRPSAAPEPGLRELETAQAARDGASHDLHGTHRRPRPGGS